MTDLPHVDQNHAVEVCKIGQGADCCRYLTMGAGGWSCEKHTASGLYLDGRVERSEMTSRGNNCEGRASL